MIAAIPDMTEVFTIITARVASKPETGLLEVIGPVWCNTTRHFLLIQVRISGPTDQIEYSSSLGSVVSGC